MVLAVEEKVVDGGAVIPGLGLAETQNIPRCPGKEGVNTLSLQYYILLRKPQL